MTRLVYFEPLSDGHCTFWAAIILKAALEDSRVTAIELVASPTLIARLGALAGNPRLSITELSERDLAPLTKGRLAARGWAQWQKARALLRQSKGDICFLPFFDHAILGACLDRRPVGGKISGTIFRPPNAFGQPASLRNHVSAWRRWAMYLTSQRPGVPKLFTLDEMAAGTGIGRATGRLTFLPDPTPDLGLLNTRTPRPRADGRKGLLLFGALSERKGVTAVLEALPLIPPEHQRALALRLVGRIRPEDRPRIEAALDAAKASAPDIVIELKDHFVRDEELAQEVVDATTILAPYQNHVGSSGVLFWAAAAGRPVLTQKTGLMGYLAEHYQLGRTVDTTDPRALAKALARDPELSAEGAKAFVATHTPQAFAATILDGLISDNSI